MKRPISVTVISLIYILAGAVGFLYHFPDFERDNLLSDDWLWIECVRVLAVVGGVLTLQGKPIGRWILVAWITYHLVLGFYHPISELIFHAALLVITVVALFHPKVNSYFKRA